MKRLLLFIGMGLFYLIVNGQPPVYQPFIPNQSQGNHNQQNLNEENINSIRTTAYYEDSYNGKVYKVPIKVQQRNYQGVSNYYIVEQYVDTRIGGKWEKIHYPPQIKKCSSLFSNNSLESQFMYKAIIGIKTYYFDL